MATDLTVKIFDAFYELDLVVNASEYEIVYSFFLANFSNEKAAKSFTQNLFRIANITQISVIDLLQSFEGSDKLKISLTMAYYLNSVSNKTILYGVNNDLAPNNTTVRNVIYDATPVAAPTLPSSVTMSPPSPPPIRTEPLADFAASTLSGTAPLYVKFTDKSTNSPTSWSWEFTNDGTVYSLLQNPIYVYNKPGVYSVKLTASNASGKDVKVKNKYITVIGATPTPPALNLNQ